jgi:hypothetical protein
MIAVAARATTGAGATLAAVGGLTVTEWMGVLGVVIALVGAIVNRLHNKRMYALEVEARRLEKVERLLRIEALRRQGWDRRRENLPVNVERRSRAQEEQV